MCKNKQKEQEFHKSRVAFLIVKNKIMFLENSTMSHYDWAKSLGQKKFDMKNFDKTTRGYFFANNIYFYSGNFDVTEQVIADAKKFTHEICEKYNISNPKVFGGMNVGEVGTVWQPKMQIM